MKGYIALHRKLMDSWVSEDPMALALWVRMLMEATHKGRERVHKGKVYKLNAGEFLFGLERWSEKTGISREVIRKRVKLFEDSGMITYSKHPKISVISVVNWGSYQIDNTLRTPSEHPQNTLRTPSEQEYNNGNNVNNVNNGNKESGAEKNAPVKQKRFTPPTFQEASDYFFEKCGDSSEAQKFIDFYQSKDWFVGKNKMKDWKAAIRNWVSRNKEKRSSNRQSDPDLFYEQLRNTRFE